jgi:hypothetical protein
VTKAEFLDQLISRVIYAEHGFNQRPPHDLLQEATAEPWFSELGDDEQFEIRALLEDRRVAQATAIAARVAACDAARDLLVPTRRRAVRFIS